MAESTTPAASTQTQTAPNADAKALAEANAKIAKLEADLARANDQKGKATMATADLKGNECPKCGAEVERYHGDNPHKQKTYFCDTCGERRPIKS
jgi:predicted RNA-binding Zn-ribbon protein involved in translation (DUF1610 family)